MTVGSGGRPATKIRESEGGGAIIRGKPYIRVTDRARHRIARLAPWATTLEEVDARGRIVQAWVNRLRQAGRVDFVPKIIDLGAAAADEAALAAASSENAAANAAAPVEKPTRGTADSPAIPRSRGGRIRTGDPLTPSQVR